ncbi:Polyketide cyclase / dehydrase and lipid transport [Aquimarina amphilecti]|uniref:Polyketide cyclase / dehydrase and lipid transport n=1 Tax=Aquimarina amphilecti TaxID=1038014 RepID=A0A1H7W9M3_AQUAM|nr:SRPBCC family protein [Aquimarina amphilecti]SEM18191.1 Polyketide cyclase / dehydrase and lipid transport [Aquimarina amphilecti]
MKYLKYLLYLIIVLTLVFFGIGFFTPSVSYENEITVNKPANESWEVMSDVSNLPKWIKGFKRTELIKGTANTVGAVSNVYVDNSGEEMVMEETITAMKLHERMAMTFTMDFMNMDYEMLFKEKGGKTMIISKSNIKGNSVFAKSLLSFMSSSMKTQEDVNLKNLKELIEKNAKDYFPEPETVIDTTAVSVDE